MKVYAVFSAYGDGDWYTTFDLFAITADLESAKEKIALSHKDRSKNAQKFDIIHEDMNESNNYTYIGKRENCKEGCYALSGYVIEEFDI